MGRRTTKTAVATRGKALLSTAGIQKAGRGTTAVTITDDVVRMALSNGEQATGSGEIEATTAEESNDNSMDDGSVSVVSEEDISDVEEKDPAGDSNQSDKVQK